MYLGIDIKLVYLYSNNQGLLSLAKNPKFHQQTKYINIKHYFIQEHIIQETVDLQYITNSEIAANGFTKSLLVINYVKFIKQLRLKVIKIN